MSVRYQSQVREVINRNIVISPALAQGLKRIVDRVYDGGVDFILYREIDGLLHNFQQGCWTINRKCIGGIFGSRSPLAVTGIWCRMT